MAGTILMASSGGGDAGAQGSSSGNINNNNNNNHSLIRSRYLTSLGIHKSRAAVIREVAASDPSANASEDDPDTQRKKSFLRGVGQHWQTRRSSSTSERTLTRNVVPFTAPLNDQAEYNKQLQQDAQRSQPLSFGGFSFGMARSSPPPTETSSKTRRIRFEPEITVVPIPSRYRFSKRIAAHLWTSSREIHENAERNMYEYQREGWSIDGVLDDLQCFYVDAGTGELVHPCWLEGENGYKIVGEDIPVEEDDTESISSYGSASSSEEDGPPPLKRSESFRFEDLSINEVASSEAQS